jgi:hypothetical protein
LSHDSLVDVGTAVLLPFSAGFADVAGPVGDRKLTMQPKMMKTYTTKATVVKLPDVDVFSFWSPMLLLLLPSPVRRPKRLRTTGERISPVANGCARQHVIVIVCVLLSEQQRRVVIFRRQRSGDGGTRGRGGGAFLGAKQTVQTFRHITVTQRNSDSGAE